MHVGLRLSDTGADACEISDLLEGVFGPIDPESAMAWQPTDEEALSASDTATLFLEASEAEDPLAVLSEKSSIARARLNALMRVRWAARKARALGHPPSLTGLTWSVLSEGAREMVREGMAHIASCDTTQVRRGQPRKNRTDTVLDGLAEIYARHTGFTLHHQSLPHAERSNFVQFVCRTLHPHLPLTELGPGAFSKRWKRLKK